MKWYLAKVVFRIICGDGDHKAQFDEQIRLITAEDATLAFFKAQELGLMEQENFVNQDRQLVQWKFINVAEIHPLREMTDGAELFSHIEEYDDAAAYIRMVNSKAKFAREKYSAQILEII